MKKVIICATIFISIFGIANMASAVTGKFTNVEGAVATTTLNGIVFSPSTNVGVHAIATTVAYAVQSKHETGGTTMYGLVSSDNVIKKQIDLVKSAGVSAPNSATALSTSGTWK